MIRSSTKGAPDPNVVFTEMENGESVLLHLGTNQYFSLNETGTLIWKKFIDGQNLGEIGKEIENTFNVSIERALQSVIQLFEELLSEKLVFLKR